jgi:hypothetical protein
MQNTSLNQFGAVLSFAINIEKILVEYYESARGKNQEYLSELEQRRDASQKRVKKLERSRRENVTEITLEPIEGLDASNYRLDVSSFDFGIINSNEEIMIKFYTEAGPKLNVLESRRLFKRCLKEYNNLQRLE